jgi:hypothetical protein
MSPDFWLSALLLAVMCLTGATFMVLAFRLDRALDDDDETDTLPRIGRALDGDR